MEFKVLVNQTIENVFYSFLGNKFVGGKWAWPVLWYVSLTGGRRKVEGGRLDVSNWRLR
jgi:hypothetical protein